VIGLAMTSQRTKASEHGAILKLHRGATFGEVSNAHPLAENRPIAPLVDNGTHHAIRYLNLSEAANCIATKGRGGARNRADRQSTALTKAQKANLRAAERHSHAISLPLTRMITIHWKAAGVPLEGMAKATGAFIDKLGKWLARRGTRTAWVWVHENTGDKCWHVHILMHIPAACVRKLPAAQKRWFKQITGRPYSSKVIRSGPIGGRLGLELSNPSLHRLNCEAALAYILKGANPEKPQGLVLGRRCSTSQNIGQKARLDGERALGSLQASGGDRGENASVIAKPGFYARKRKREEGNHG